MRTPTRLVFLCAGEGRRLGATAERPKALSRVGDETLIGRLVRQFKPFHTAAAPPVFVVSSASDAIQRHLRGLLPEATFAVQPEPTGIANAMIAANVAGRSLFVLGDLFMDGEFPGGLDVPAPAVGVWPEGSEREIRKNFGVRYDETQFLDLVEKPADAAGLVCGIGVYLLDPRVIAMFAAAPGAAGSTERGITDALRFVHLQGTKLAPLVFKGTYINVNAFPDLEDANAFLATDRP